jgi:Queuosine biosynthesis protein QueC
MRVGSYTPSAQRRALACPTEPARPAVSEARHSSGSPAESSSTGRGASIPQREIGVHEENGEDSEAPSSLAPAGESGVRTDSCMADEADLHPALADELGGNELVDLIVEHTHTCYDGDRTHRHAWGYGCGTCPACQLRADGFTRYLPPNVKATVAA